MRYMDPPKKLKISIKQKAVKWGVDLIGFAPVGRFKDFPSKNNPKTMLDGAKTVVVLAINMVDPSLDLWLHTAKWKLQGRPSRAFEDEILRAIAYRISLMIERSGYETRVIPYEPSIFLKEAGYYAGLGVFGKNNLLLNPKYGPNIRLRALVTNVPFSPDPISNEDLCKDCTSCIEACPADALDQGYVMEKCLKYCESHLVYLTRQAVLWCVKCIEACPHTKTDN
jgi:epoxyqueuosine reductase